jgi:hypothetical protein
VLDTHEIGKLLTTIVLRTWPIDKRIGQVRNDGPELLEPREASEEADTAEQSLL